MWEGGWELKKKVWPLMLWANVIKGGGEGGPDFNTIANTKIRSNRWGQGGVLGNNNFFSFVI